MFSFINFFFVGAMLACMMIWPSKDYQFTYYTVLAVVTLICAAYIYNLKLWYGIFKDDLKDGLNFKSWQIKSKFIFCFGAITVLIGIWIRCVLLNFSPLWFDEYLQIINGLNNPFDAAIFHSQPSLFYYLNQIFLVFGGMNETAARMLPLLFGIGQILWIPFLGRRLAWRPYSIHIALCTVAGSYILIRYSVEGRPYSACVFFMIMYLMALVEHCKVGRREANVELNMIASGFLFLNSSGLQPPFIMLFTLFYVWIFHRSSGRKFNLSFIHAGLVVTFIPSVIEHIVSTRLWALATPFSFAGFWDNMLNNYCHLPELVYTLISSPTVYWTIAITFIIYLVKFFKNSQDYKNSRTYLLGFIFSLLALWSFTIVCGMLADGADFLAVRMRYFLAFMYLYIIYSVHVIDRVYGEAFFAFVNRHKFKVYPATILSTLMFVHFYDPAFLSESPTDVRMVFKNFLHEVSQFEGKIYVMPMTLVRNLNEPHTGFIVNSEIYGKTQNEVGRPIEYLKYYHGDFSGIMGNLSKRSDFSLLGTLMLNIRDNPNITLGIWNYNYYRTDNVLKKTKNKNPLVAKYDSITTLTFKPENGSVLPVVKRYFSNMWQEYGHVAEYIGIGELLEYIYLATGDQKEFMALREEIKEMASDSSSYTNKQGAREAVGHIEKIYQQHLN